MANVMDLRLLKNKPHRSDFDLSSKVAFTAKTGELLPVRVIPTLPGDKFRFKSEMFTRTVPLNTPGFLRVREYMDFFFVPYRLLWDKFTQYIVQTNDPHYASSITQGAGSFSSHPYFTDTDLYSVLSGAYGDMYGVDIAGLNIRSQSYKLLQYLGYAGCLPNANAMVSGDVPEFSSTALNPFPLLAYQKIYNDHYRNSQWESSSPWTYNLDYIFKDNDLHIDCDSAVQESQKGQNMFTLRYANWKSDRVMGIQPTQQFGSAAVAGPLSGSIDVFIPAGSRSIGGSNILLSFAPNASQTNPHQLEVGTGASGNRVVVNDTVPRDGAVSILSGSIGGPSLSGTGSFSNIAGLSVLALRQAEALQKWKEITLSGSKDYRDQIARHWGVTPSADMSDLSRRIGGFVQDINISEVVNQNLASSDSDADLAGKGIGSSRDSFEFETKEYGVIMAIYHNEPLLDFAVDTNVSRQLLTVTAEQYPIPELDSIGLQEVIRSEIAYTQVRYGINSDVVGYAPRYFDYKTSLDVVMGGFLNTSAFGNWVSPYTRTLLGIIMGADSVFPLTYDFFKVRPAVLNSVFVSQIVQAEGDISTPLSDFADDQFLVNCMFSVYSVRNLSKYGLPY